MFIGAFSAYSSLAVRHPGGGFCDNRANHGPQRRVFEYALSLTVCGPRHMTCTAPAARTAIGLWTLTTSRAHYSTRQSARLCRFAQIALRGERAPGTRRTRRHRIL